MLSPHPFLRFLFLQAVPLAGLTAPAAALAAASSPAPAHHGNTTYNNPILPGWHSDPSCAFAAHLDNTFFCVTSSFLSFPGLPVYASRDLVTWHLASNALSRPTQIPDFVTAVNMQGLGIFAPTIRLHEGVFYIITVWINSADELVNFIVFTSPDPRDEKSWSDPIKLETPGKLRAIDPDIFWDDATGRIVMAFANTPVKAAYIDLATGKTSEPFDMWAGTGGAHTEGPHIYKKDGWYYLLISEGGTQLGHKSTIARSRDLEAGEASWEVSPFNPLVSNAGTDEFFQGVGHADLFQDSEGDWWGVALATRGGPGRYDASEIPMGRETVLLPVRWDEGGWPVADTVRGVMSGPLPPPVAEGIVPGQEDYVVGQPDVVDFAPGSSIPHHWVYMRAPKNLDAFTVSPEGHPNTLRLTGTRNNLTVDPGFDPSMGLAFVARRQEASLSEFSVDLQLGFGQAPEDEAGITVFNDQNHHVDLGVVYQTSECGRLQPSFRVRATQLVQVHTDTPADVVVPVPQAWIGSSGSAVDIIRLCLSTVNSTHYKYSASLASAPDDSRISLSGFTSALLTTDGAGSAAIMGAYATTNGAADNRTVEAYFSHWRYLPAAQEIDYGVFVPA